MKNYLKPGLIIAIFAISFSLASAHMTGTPAETGTAVPTLTHEQEVAQGLALYQKLQAKQMSCADFKDADYGLMGEYFMGEKMTMAEHDQLNTQLVSMMGNDGEESTHINIGKHGSNCDTAVVAGATDTTGANMMGAEHHMDMDHMGTNTETQEYFSPLMLLLYLFALIGLFSVIKMVVVSAQKKESLSATPEVKK